MSRKVIYEITATVENKLAAAYEKYMRERHIPDLLATNCFSRARFARSSENGYQIQYEARSQTALDEYLKTHAAKMRADFAAHFPAGVRLSRQIWTSLKTWESDETNSSGGLF